MLANLLQNGSVVHSSTASEKQEGSGYHRRGVWRPGLSLLRFCSEYAQDKLQSRAFPSNGVGRTHRPNELPSRINLQGQSAVPLIPVSIYDGSSFLCDIFHPTVVTACHGRSSIVKYMYTVLEAVKSIRHFSLPQSRAHRFNFSILQKIVYLSPSRARSSNEGYTKRRHGLYWLRSPPPMPEKPIHHLRGRTVSPKSSRERHEQPQAQSHHHERFRRVS